MESWWCWVTAFRLASMKYLWVRLLSRSSFFSNMRWEADKTSRYFIITSDSSELTSTMSGRASASGVKHLQKEHSLMKANYFFLKTCLLPRHSSIGIYQAVLAREGYEDWGQPQLQQPSKCGVQNPETSEKDCMVTTQDFRRAEFSLFKGLPGRISWKTALEGKWKA